ncbi:hypothetical protein [Paenibacillus odorifer]|nr:hypothetical protein [Paenibacillus odorifer]
MERKRGKNTLDLYGLSESGQMNGINPVEWAGLSESSQKNGINPVEWAGSSESSQKNGINPVDMAGSISNCFSKTLVTYVRCDITIRRLNYRLCDVHATVSATNYIVRPVNDYAHSRVFFRGWPWESLIHNHQIPASR